MVHDSMLQQNCNFTSEKIINICVAIVANSWSIFPKTSYGILSKVMSMYVEGEILNVMVPLKAKDLHKIYGPIYWIHSFGSFQYSTKPNYSKEIFFCFLLLHRAAETQNLMTYLGMGRGRGNYTLIFPLNWNTVPTGSRSHRISSL